MTLTQKAGAVMALGLLAVSATACVILVQRVKVSSVDPRNNVTVNSSVKAHLKDGSVIVFPNGMTISGGVVRGEGFQSDITFKQLKGVQEVPLDSVVGMESFRTSTNMPKTILLSTAATAGAVVGTAALFVAIFGSCPTVYSDDSKTEEAELFSNSIAPLFEARDIDRLRATPGAAGMVRLEVRNEAMETHYINHLQLLETMHNRDETVLPAVSGELIAVRNVKAPDVIKDRRGQDVRDLLLAADGNAFATDVETIASANSADMDDWLDFDAPVNNETHMTTFVFRMRNSLLSTTLLYDVMLGPAGARSLDWLNQDLTRISTAVELGRWHQRRSGLHISVWRDGAWQEVARIPDSGPITWHDVAATIPAKPGERSLRTRLSFLADHWRVDYLGVAGSSRQVKPRIIPVSGLRTTGVQDEREATAAIASPDDVYLQTNPGQRFFVAFEAGPAPAAEARTFLLSSQGYYTEWIRGKWIQTATASEPFVPTDASLLTALRQWSAKRDTFEKQFRERRVPIQ